MKHAFDSFTRFLRPSKRTVLMILAAAVITVAISAIVSLILQRTANLSVPSLGTIKTLGVEAYWDSNLTDKIDDYEPIDWGILWVGSSNNITIYLKSMSNIKTALNLSMADLTFASTAQGAIHPPQNISSHINLIWDYDGSLVNPGDVIQVTLTISATYSRDFILYLIENDVENFSLEIHIQTTESTV